MPGGGRPYVTQVEAAPDGSAFTFWTRRQPNIIPPVFHVLRLNGAGINHYQGVQATMAPSHASIDGGPVFTCDGFVYTAELKPIDTKELRGTMLLPVQISVCCLSA